MMRIRRLPERYGHFVYGMLQSGVTTGVATGIATVREFGNGVDFAKWGQSWVASWALMVPIVIFAAPFIQRLTLVIIRGRGEG